MPSLSMPNVVLGFSLSPEAQRSSESLISNSSILVSGAAGAAIATGPTAELYQDICLKNKCGKNVDCQCCLIFIGDPIAFLGVSTIVGWGLFWGGRYLLSALITIGTEFARSANLLIYENDLRHLNEAYPTLTLLAQLIKTVATLAWGCCLIGMICSHLNFDFQYGYSVYGNVLIATLGVAASIFCSMAAWYANDRILAKTFFLMKNIFQRMNAAMAEHSFKREMAEVLKLSCGIAMFSINALLAFAKSDLSSLEQTALYLTTVFTCCSSLVLGYNLAQSVGRRLTCHTFFGGRNENVGVNNEQRPLMDGVVYPVVNRTDEQRNLCIV